MVPCKLFGVLAAGRPALLLGRLRVKLPESLMKKLGGVTIDQGDVDALVGAIQSYAESPDLLQSQWRCWP